ncbi:ABC transporter substrate-binding protein [Paenarthrobacter sp. DKR-5]|uniref:ABC transporter substrate-binding protein n=1 Tax=Paenarthrobacter sp. DKR-5 TaxID=2835535 RepID=UPI001BDBB2D1|nr:ABC transporter substrate-binding protein [Paenarthrobacter sp. DKR-5]MBT1004309.1 ABC transporter substrate-binding protein [Paenarthrobacter sp. DKR-5]
MAHPIDVGSVLGGRYKVTEQVLVSHDQDLVLDGVDQVLNRPVSILVAGPSNASQVSQSAREVATGERPGTMQILDLGVSDGTTYLITNHASAADLLDLIVVDNPPYVEPFFTDTLGSEIFGEPRSTEPEIYEDDYADEEEEDRPSFLERFGRGRTEASRSGQQSGPAAGAAGAAAAAAGGAAASRLPAPPAPPQPAPAPAQAEPAAFRQASYQQTAPPAQQVGRPAEAPTAAAPRVPDPTEASRPVPQQAPPAEKPKVTLWSNDEYDSTGYPPEAGDAPRKASNFPASARSAQPMFDDTEDDYVTDPDAEPRSRRWLVGGIIGVILVAALVFAFTNLGSLFSGNNTAASNGPSAPQQTQSAAAGPQSAAPTSAPAKPTVAPEIVSASRIPTPGTDIYSQFDGELPKMIDGNPASYWSKLEFASADFGGFAKNLVVAIQLKQPSDISSVAISQLGGSGGSFSILVNDKPSLDGAKEVARNSFTAPEITLPVSPSAKGQYVIINVTQLPKLQNPLTQYPFGLRIAEVKVQ